MTIAGAPQVIRTSARDLAASVNSGALDPVELVEAFIGAIEARNPTLNALVGFDPELARSEAAAVRRRHRAGERMVLAGVPVVVKDNIWVGGRRITQGSRLFAEHIAPQDAISVSRLKQAGAIIIGIGNCPEFACKGVTNSPLHGATRHPLDDRLTPGGSSGGNAAALAADFAPVALGTDGGGSGRRPPAHTGTVGLKPSFGAIPYGPGFPEPFWGIAVIAPMGRTVADVAALFSAVAGPDPLDPESTAIEVAPRVDPRDLRIAFSPRLGLDAPVDADVGAAIEEARHRLGAAGWRIMAADPFWPAGTNEAALMPLQAAGLAALHGKAWRKDAAQFDPDVAAQIKRGLALEAADVGLALEASALIKRAFASFMAEYDLLLCPTAPCVSWPHAQLGPEQIGGVQVGPRGHAVFTPWFNHALAPAISIPCGQGQGGLPVGLQIVGRRGTDNLVLAAADAAEAVLAPMNTYARC